MNATANHSQVIGDIQCMACSYIGEEWMFRNKYSMREEMDSSGNTLFIIRSHTHCPICDSKKINFNFDKKPEK